MKTIKRYLVIFLILGIMLSACTQEEVPQTASESNIQLQITQVDTSQFPTVSVYISAKDQAGNPVPVPLSDIELLEDGKPITSTAIQGMDTISSFTSVLLMDSSGSMANLGKLESAKEAATGYVEQMRSADQAAIIAFNTQVTTFQEITTDKEVLLTAINLVGAQGNTAMWNALKEAVEMLNAYSGRKAIVLLTDGMDNESVITPEEVLSMVGDSGLSISSIGFGVQPEEEQDPDIDEGIDEETLKWLAAEAGGVYAYVQETGQLSGLFNTIRESLQSEAVITYTTPMSLRDGVKRALSVRMTGSWQAQVSGSFAGYNPGGLIPEVPIRGNWLLFGILLAALTLAVLIPVVIVRQKAKRKKKKIRIVLKD